MSEEEESVESLREKLSTYESQLKQINELIEKEPENPDWKKLKSDLEEIVALTKTLISKETVKNKPIQKEKIKNVVAEEKVKENNWYPSVGDACEALYDSRWYPVFIKNKNDDDTFTVIFYTFGNEETMTLTNLRPLQNIAEVPLPKHQIQIGHQYQALFSADRKWFVVKATLIFFCVCVFHFRHYTRSLTTHRTRSSHAHDHPQVRCQSHKNQFKWSDCNIY